ncbi:MAG: hypothetical protein EPO57_04130 [Chitinophagaceae bacterium]|nr:MAG: hypothetical protein EPO57_04130 [Chitinophagaceae bacterium]
MIILYIDPGSGSLLFQALLSGLLTIIVFFKRIVSFLKFKFRRDDETNSELNTDPVPDKLDRK